MLKINRRNTIDLRDWDDLVQKTYKKIYSFQQQDDCKGRGIENIRVPSEDPIDHENTEIPFEVNGEEMGVSFETWLNTTPEETRKHFEEDYENRIFWDRNFYPNVDMIINDLHSKGLIESGDYDIIIDW